MSGLTTSRGPRGAAVRRPVAKWYNDPIIRGWVFQGLLAALVALAVYSAASNAIENLTRQKIASGFGFWNNIAGFPIGFSLIPYDVTMHYGRAFWVGLLNTLLVSILGIILATMLGFFIGVGQLSKNWLVAKICYWYVQIFRNIPLLLILFFWYNAVLKQLPELRESAKLFDGAIVLNNRGLYVPDPVAGSNFHYIYVVIALGLAGALAYSLLARRRQALTGKQSPVLAVWAVLGLGLPLLAFGVLGAPLTFILPEAGRFNIAGGIQIVPEFLALLSGLSIYTAAFIAEVVRAGIRSVSHGQTEAAYALGIRPSTTLKLIVIPQAMRVIIPPLTSQYLNLTKNSSLAVAIGYPDLVQVFAGTTLNQTGQALEVIAITMAVYLTLSLLTAFGMNWYNARKALVER